MPETEVRVPALGESVVEATIGTWLKQAGEAVAAGEPLVQLETEKVNVDVAAERAGVLARITRQDGETVQVGEVIAFLGERAAAATPTAAAPPSGKAAPAADSFPIAETESAAPTPSASVERPHASPIARRLADEHGVDLSTVVGSGTAGRVTREDVERHLAPPARDGAGASPSQAQPAAVPQPAAAPAVSGGSAARPEERQRLSRRRQTIAARLLEAQRTAAILTTFNEVDMSAVMALRTRRRDAFKERHGVSLGFMSFFTRAVVGALKAFPTVNAEITPAGDEVILKRYYDIGVAVGAAEGLVVPVLRDADRKTFAEIEREIGALAEKARTNTLTLDDLRGGTFTITNGGVYGSLMSTPILSPPQVGILGMHAIQERPVVRTGEIVVRPMMYLALSYDHRLVDGREAVQFLARVKELIEDPESLLLEG